MRRVLVQNAGGADIGVTMAPGATALVTALVLSGLPVHSFTFRGFPPRKRGPRLRFLQVDADSPHTLIFYESPHRLASFLRDAIEAFGDRQAAIAKDLTKLYERVDRGSLSSLCALVEDVQLKGEYVVVIAGASYGMSEAEPADAD